MKKKEIKYFCIVTVILFISISFFTPTLSSIDNNSENADLSLEFDYSFSNPSIECVDTNENVYLVYINGLPLTNEYKQPKLPIKPLSILLPYETEVSRISIKTSEKTIIAKEVKIKEGGALIPIKKLENNQKKSSEIFNQQRSYSTQDNYESLYSMIGTYIIRGYRILNVNLHPIQYSKSSGSLYFYKNMHVTIHLKNAPSAGGLRNCEYDKNIVNKYVENPEIFTSYEDAKSNIMPLNEQYEYIIITNEKMKNAEEEYTFQDLITYKESKGVTATIVTIEEINENPDYSVNGIWGDNNRKNPFFKIKLNGERKTFDDTQARIRNFIRYAYTKWGTKFVLLAGDSDANNPKDVIVPHRGLFADERGLPLYNTLEHEMDDIPSDVYYACLDGNFNYDGDNHFGDAPKFNSMDDSIDEADLYAEVFVGRACVDSTEEVSNFVKKTISYDEIFYDEYFSRMMFLGEYLGNQYYFNWGGEYKDLIDPLVPSEYDLIKLYQKDDSWDSDLYWSILNNNPTLIINHFGHGNPTSAMGLSCRTIEQIINDKYYFIFSHTCLAGAFDNHLPPNTYYDNDCIAEYFTVETEHGAVGAIMNSRYGLVSKDSPESPSGAYDESLFKALYTQNIRQIGPANHYSKEDNIWHINENGLRWAFYSINLFGDPEISIKDPLPNLNINASILKPENQSGLYINDDKFISIPFLNKPFIIGGITIKSDIETNPSNMIEFVEFIIDNEVMIVDKQYPYEFFWESYKIGVHEIKIKAYAPYGIYAQDSIQIFYLY